MIETARARLSVVKVNSGLCSGLCKGSGLSLVDQEECVMAVVMN